VSKPVLPPPLKAFDTGRTVGLTTTVPVEVILAAGLTPVDVNNLFITSSAPGTLVALAEEAGFPRTCCCWTRGIYGAVRYFGLQRIVGVTQGDCSNTHALMEMLRFEGVECVPFEFPYQPDVERMELSISAFARTLGAAPGEAEHWRRELASVRQKAAEIDRLTWQEARVHGVENHLWLVSTSDFCADAECYEHEAERFLAIAAERPPIQHHLRLGYAGVPPITPEIYSFLESLGALVVYNETQRQFAMPEGGGSLAEQYSRYTYPYGIFARLEDIKTECERRALDGLVHYVQSFCYRRIEDKILRSTVRVPVLTVECDLPGGMSGQLRTRLEAFVQMLEARKRGKVIF
jgi:benzoyl-CoA reductase/2-hydroxyglutaryl-CoA dehydratase subunit BcrC/BadD/HgdB